MARKVEPEKLAYIHNCFAQNFEVDGAYQKVRDNNTMEKKDGELRLTKRIVTAIKNNQQKGE